LKGGFGPLSSCLQNPALQSIDDAIVPDVEADGGTVTEDRAAVVTHLAILRVDVHCWG